MASYLKVSGTKIVDGDGNEVILRGAGLGGWMKYVPPTCRAGTGLITISRSMENFIAGYPGCEFQIRAALADVVGNEKSTFFFDKVCDCAGLCSLPAARSRDRCLSFFILSC